MANIRYMEETHCTRQLGSHHPAEGEPTKIVNGIEVHTLEAVAAKEIRYATRQDWERTTSTLQGKKRIALEYSLQ